MSGGSGLIGDWDKAIQLFGNNPVKKAIDLARNQIGIAGASMVKKGIRDGAPGGKTFEPLSNWTKERKGSSKPLIDNGDLLGSVTHELNGNSDVWIGVKRGRAKNGQEIVNIAAVHEFGTVISATPKMRAYLHYQGIHLKRDTFAIYIPERSFLRATFDSSDFKKMLGDKMAEALRRALNLA
jgi:phage gpG-like protein